MSAAISPTPRICVVGNAAIDLNLRVAHLPSPGETTLALDSTSDFGGKGANQAVAAARAGAPTLLFAAIGQDADGDRLITQLNAEGIDTRHILRVPCPTDISIVTVDAAGENTIVTRNHAATGYRPARRALLDATQAGDWIALQGNLSAEVTAEVLRTARLGACRTLLNPGPVRFDCLPLLADVDVLVVNRVEAATLTAQEDASLAAAALQRAGARDVCVTLGADGVLWCDDHGTSMRCIPRPSIQSVPAMPFAAHCSPHSPSVCPCRTRCAGPRRWPRSASPGSVRKPAFPTAPPCAIYCMQPSLKPPLLRHVESIWKLLLVLAAGVSIASSGFLAAHAAW
jgi:ribokinase